MYWPNSCTTWKQTLQIKWLQNINSHEEQLYRMQNWISPCDDHARNHAPKNTSRSPGSVHRVYCAFSIHSAYLVKSQSENRKSSWCVQNRAQTCRNFLRKPKDSNNCFTLTETISGFKMAKFEFKREVHHRYGQGSMCKSFSRNIYKFKKSV